MGIRYRDSRLLLVMLGALLGLSAAACSAETAAPGPAEVPYSTFVLQLPEQYGSSRRTPVVYDHLAHVEALADRGCIACHAEDGRGGLFPLLAEAWPSGDRDDLMNVYHDGCTGCHKQQIKAPITCGECHTKQSVPKQREIGKQPEPFMNRLHDRHIEALADRCGDCHHEPDEKTGALVYVEGNEAPCGDCHKRDGGGGAPSLKSASHAACVGCHTGRAARKQKPGAVLCEGCHTVDKP